MVHDATVAGVGTEGSGSNDSPLVGNAHQVPAAPLRRGATPHFTHEVRGLRPLQVECHGSCGGRDLGKRRQKTSDFHNGGLVVPCPHAGLLHQGPNVFQV